MGCPVRKIAGRDGAGVALMREPERAAAVVRAIRAAVRVPVTAKIRAGWDDAHVNAPEVARRLEDAGAAMIAVHARTRAMVHTGEARLAIVRAVKEAVRVPVFGNGGVATLADARRMHRETGCDGVMIGRGAHGNPWIFRALAQGGEHAPSAAERFAVMLRHVELYRQWAGDERTAREMRKHLAWYAAHAPGGAALRVELARMDTAAAMREAVERHRDAVLAGRVDAGAATQP
jgi:nifR3 family TIM-barrel protein